ncbi:MAG: SDR family oxidoreductase [Vibrio hibernica]
MNKNTVLITGGSRNIGASITKYLKAIGYITIVADINSPEDSSDVDYFYPVDFNQLDEAKSVLEVIMQSHQPLNLVNNVGIVKPAPLDDVDVDDFQLLMNINARSALLATQAIVPSMKECCFGRIVTTTSRVILGKELRTCYSATKGALTSMSKTWALELAQYGITVNCVAPGPIATTAFWDNNPKDSPQYQKIISSVPAKKMGSVDDVAHAVQFFLDEKSHFITGQTLFVCGGITVGLAS